jgi:HD superfamily phosphodiesterase
VRSRVISVVLVVVPLTVGGATAVAWWPGIVFPALVVTYLVAYVVTTPTAPDRRVSLSMGVAGAIALLSGGSLVVVLGPAAIALPLGRLIVHVRHGPRVVRDMFPAEPIGVLVFALGFAGGLLTVSSTSPAHPGVLAVFGLAAILGFAATVFARSLLSEQRRVVARRLIALRTLEDWPVYTIVYSSVALFAVTTEPMGWWAVPLAGLPYLFSYVSLHRLQGTRRTYDQTIRALGAIPEASGQVVSGHSARTAELAVSAGAEIGLSASELGRLEYAALLHDIGRIALANPTVGSDYSFSDVAGWSAAIIGEAKYLEKVAAIVARQHAPYRREGQVRDQNVTRSSQLIRIAARYDSDVAEGAAPMEAMEVLHQGAAYDYDPELVMALRRVLERRGAFAA